MGSAHILFLAGSLCTVPTPASSIKLDGVLNDPTAPTAAGWGTVTRWAWADLAQFHTQARPQGRPLPADFWRINFSRVQWRYVLLCTSYCAGSSGSTHYLM